MGDLGIVFQAHLLEHARAIHTDCFRTQRKRLGDLRQLLSGRDQAHGLILAVGQLGVRRRVAGIGEMGGEHVGQAGGDVAASTRDGLDRVDQPVRRAVFGQIT